MNEQAMTKLSLLTSLTGIIALVLFACYAEPETIRPEQVTLNLTSKLVRTEGKITDIRDNPDIKILELNNVLNAVVFTKGNLKIDKNQKVALVGKVKEYKGKPEIVVQRIEIKD